MEFTHPEREKQFSASESTEFAKLFFITLSGVAYILKLLDQYHEFDSLHWFQSVRDKYKTDKVPFQSLFVLCSELTSTKMETVDRLSNL